MSNRIAREGSKISSMPPRKGGLARIWHALFYSLAGIRSCYRSEAAFRQEVWLTAILVPLALMLPLSPFFKAFLIGSMLLVLVVELLNSAVEVIVDKMAPEFETFAKQAKDMGSAAVFFALAHLFVAWTGAIITIFWR